MCRWTSWWPRRGGPGRRGARIRPHADGTARKARGLEAALVDRERVELGALDAADPRSFDIWIAGPGALLVAKLLKIADRLGTPSRLENKDALDVFRLLRDVDLSDLVVRLRRLRVEAISAAVTTDALARLRELFATPDALGVRMVVDATTGLKHNA